MKPYRLKMFKEDSQRNDWRWDLVAPNGEIVASAGEGYRNRKDCIRIWRLLFPWITLGDSVYDMNGTGTPPGRLR